jgi:hypothetical protein
MFKFKAISKINVIRTQSLVLRLTGTGRPLSAVQFADDSDNSSRSGDIKVTSVAGLNVTVASASYRFASPKLELWPTDLTTAVALVLASI